MTPCVNIKGCHLPSLVGTHLIGLHLILIIFLGRLIYVSCVIDNNHQVIDKYVDKKLKYMIQFHQLCFDCQVYFLCRKENN